jgi:hypothetical protein
MFYTGTTVRLSGTFKNLAGVNTAPTTVKAIYKDPTGATTEALFSSSGVGGWLNTATGIYTFDTEVNLPGQWTYAFEGTGAVDVYGPSTFEVHARPAG